MYVILLIFIFVNVANDIGKGIGEMFVEYRCTSFEKFTGYLVNTSSFLDINFLAKFCFGVCVCWFVWGVFYDTVYARVVLMENYKKDVCDTINFYFCKCCK
jgi:hypothetical protein